ncbi:putative glutathione S-transferase [Aspergillus steynii IBT 23096]|uniref:glutathione transferase n=1 Tax=Aspergillus steynii IBT 23096 TaxID=1392250 RepID=A0A2I2FZK2_9EURO|nr:putative glutathione S-transferase [Aspergillus steynii IBT 23096]PLB46062.1 putative glutathione S-transferase [Aspergillus steynii IBT 23096]
MSPKPIVLYIHPSGPNPWKVVAVLEELSIPYETRFLHGAAIKQEPFISVNPNGRLPAIEDPNTNITLWESGAILEYLVETYDKERTVSFEPGTPEYFHAKQWLHFQMSGQGPYFGQFVWFSVHHAEKIPSAQERYLNEVKRVSGVLDKFLEGREWLVGGKFSYVDAAFLPWFGIMGRFTGDAIDLEKDFPNLDAWLKRLNARPAIAKTQKDRAAAAESHK